MKEMLQALTDLLKEKAPCQNAPEDDDNVQGDHDEVLIESVTDVISGLSEICGSKFDALLKTFVPLLLKFNQPQRPYNDRAMAIGCIAECAEHMGSNIVPYLADLFPILLKALTDPHAAVRRNTAFCVGVLALNGGDPVKKYYPAALAALKPLFDSSDTKVLEKLDDSKFEGKEEKEHRIPARDNACSAVAKMITTHPGSFNLNDPCVFS